jgi:hypothetical protein
VVSQFDTLYLKLLGSYEKEIISVIEQLSHGNIIQVIDIGIAEGYYEIGFAMSLSHGKVYAYNADLIARRQCNEMPIMNWLYCTPI